MDEELRELAALALRNAFYTDFSALVNKYLELAKGMDIDYFEMQLGEMTSVYGRDTKAVGDVFINLWTKNTGDFMSSTSGHDSILEALEFDRATEVHLQGEKIFERRDGEWYFTQDEEDE